jgi:hypothetical protein
MEKSSYHTESKIIQTVQDVLKYKKGFKSHSIHQNMQAIVSINEIFCLNFIQQGKENRQ